MIILKKEIDTNFEEFYETTPQTLSLSVKEASKYKEIYRESYRSITSLQAWRTFIEIKVGAKRQGLDFFLEAQNDALVSHSLARQGAWRPALMALRSCIENALCCLFYLDHPVEYKLWESGQYRIGFTELVKYLDAHPNFSRISQHISGLEGIKAEYAQLSRAVHASSKAFRVTASGSILGLNIVSGSSISAWRTREKKLISSLSLILCTFFCEEIKGTSHLNLRKVISLSVSKKQKEHLKKDLNINLFIGRN